MSKNPQQPKIMLTGGFGRQLTPPELEHGPTHLAFAGATRVLSAQREAVVTVSLKTHLRGSEHTFVDEAHGCRSHVLPLW